MCRLGEKKTGCAKDGRNRAWQKEILQIKRDIGVADLNLEKKAPNGRKSSPIPISAPIRPEEKKGGQLKRPNEDRAATVSLKKKSKGEDVIGMNTTGPSVGKSAGTPPAGGGSKHEPGGFRINLETTTAGRLLIWKKGRLSRRTGQGASDST